MNTKPIGVIACGALAREILDVIELNQWNQIELKCLDAELHNHPKRIAGKLREKIDEIGHRYQHIIIGYGDCGSGGDIDRLIEDYTQQGMSLSRIEGAHCYQFFMGSKAFNNLEEQGLGNFYLTDFLVKHFERIIVKGFKLDKHPELKSMMFSNYTQLVFISQTAVTNEIMQQAKDIAAYLMLPFKHIEAGYGDLVQGLNVQALNIS